MKPSREEPVHDSPGNLAEKNKDRRAQQRGTSNYILINLNHFIFQIWNFVNIRYRTL